MNVSSLHTRRLACAFCFMRVGKLDLSKSEL